MPAKAPCDRFTPHLFLKNGRCRDCDFLESEHFTVDSTEGRGRAATLEQKVDLLVKDGCTHYTPHAWLVDRCRDCGRAESVHLTSAGSIDDEGDEDAGPTKRTVKHAPIRNAQEIAAMGSASRRSSQLLTANAFKLRRGRRAAAAGTVDEDDEDDDEDDGSLDYAQRVMDKAVAQMVLMDQELEDVKAQEASSLQAAAISQAQYDANLASIQAAFEAKEAELRAEVEAAKAAIDAAQAKARDEAEADARRQEAEAKAVDAAKDELARMREEAERAREEAAALRAEAAAARSQAEEERGERERARQAEEEERERGRQAELDAARAEVANARAEAETARAEAAQQREEQERREREAAEEREAAAALKRAEAEEVKEQETQVTYEPAVLPVPDSTTTAPVTPTLAPTPAEEEEPQPTVAPSSLPTGPYSGTVNLNDVLLKVEKLFLSGKNFFRFQYSKPGAVICALFLRVIGDEYVLCWSKGNSRVVRESRSLAFSDVKAIVVGKQAAVFRRPEFALASDAQCFSIIGGRHCLHLMAGNERDAEMTAFGLASLLKESRLQVSVFDHGQYREANDAVMAETAQEAGEEDDDAPVADLTDVDQLITGTSTQHLTVSLSVRCAGLPLTHQNALVCLVDREEKTDRLVYVSQTERISKNANPDFTRPFTIEYEVGSCRELRFNVYDVAAKTQTIDDGDRLGSVRVDIRELVEFDGVDFVFALSHRDHAKNFRLIRQQSQLTVTCTKKEAQQSAAPAYATQRLSVDNVQLAAMQSMLIKGDIFTSYTENAPSYPATVYYRCQNEEAEKAFTLGQLHFAVHGGGKADAEGIPLRSICDVYVGKKQRSFPSSAVDECCFSLLSKNGVRLDLEAKSRTQRDDFVNAITALLKHAASEAKKKAHAKLGTGRRF